MSAAARRLSRPDAARVIVDRALELMKTRPANGSRFGFKTLRLGLRRCSVRRAVCTSLELAGSA